MIDFYKEEKEAVLSTLETTEKGISSQEASKRLETNGKNKLKEEKKESFFHKFLMQFKDYLILILIASVIISVIVGIVEKDYMEFVDAGVIAFVLLLNAFIGVIQEEKADKAMQGLKNMTKADAKVMRNGNLLKIKAEDLVVGDIVVLEAGDSVPADLRLLELASLKIEESALTGESVPVEKNVDVISKDVAIADRLNMAYMGTTVVYGRGTGVVVATGMNSEIGKIASMLHEAKQEDTPLTKKVKRTSGIISIIVLVIAAFILIYGIASGDGIISSLTFAIVIAVCAVPEGLPACITITMALGVSEMSKHKAIVKNLSSVETLGSTEVICSDKTGTLTLNKMVVMDEFVFDETNLVRIRECQDESCFNECLKESVALSELLNCMLLCNDSQLKVEDGKLVSVGDPTEVALSEYGYKFGIIKENVEIQNRRVDEIPFDSERKLMTTLNNVDGKFVSYTKGAVDNLIDKCSRVLIEGKVEEFTDELKEQVLKENSRMAKSALRVLGFGFKINKTASKKTLDEAEQDIIFVGLVGMMDPPREEVFEAIKVCRKAGILPIMITGDHKETAFAIAQKLGIASDESEVITGQELNNIPDEEFCKVVTKYRVYARVNPEHKVRVVEALKTQDKIVAMTGDGVNDAPSIKRADIGIGMGITGTDVTKSAADVILTDDNFATIVGAVKEGRRIYDNILKIIMFCLGTAFAELIIMTTIITILRESFFSPIVILWINIVTDSLMAISLGLEGAEDSVMSRRPKRSKSLFDKQSTINMLYSCVVVSALVLGVFFISKYVLNFDAGAITAMCYITLVLAELFHAYNLKSATESLFNKNLFKNKWLNWSFLGALLLGLIIVVIPVASFVNFFGFSNLNWFQWLIAIGAGILIVPFVEVEKLIVRIVKKIKENKKKVSSKN